MPSRRPDQPFTRFRPCIDLHEGRVKQIVGGTLTDHGGGLETNFVSDRPAEWFADRYRMDDLRGGHVILLGSGNTAAAQAALAAYRDGLQVGGGITAETAGDWLSAGATHVIATSFLFDADGHFQEDRLAELVSEVGWEQLVIDLSCRTRPAEEGGGWVVAMRQWQQRTNLEVTHDTLDALAGSCAEFLIHAADVEGRCQGIDTSLVRLLGSWGKKPVTYAGGARSLEDLHLVEQISGGRVDLTIGSALDIFGGSLVKYAECVEFNHRFD